MQNFEWVWSGVIGQVRCGVWLGGLEWSFLLDGITVQMCLLILVITFCVILYSTEYMAEDPHSIRFLALLCLFSFFRLMLVSNNNVLQMFIGWEGVLVFLLI